MSSGEEEKIFSAAADHLQLIASKLGDDDLLYLYGRYKLVTEGPCNTTKPSFLNITACKKWNAWKKLDDLNRSDAMSQYIALVRKLDPSWEYSAHSNGRSGGFGVTVSRMVNNTTDTDIVDGDKDVFDWCKEGRLKHVIRLYNPQDPIAKDDEKRTLLHWACDRGHLEIVEHLLKNKHPVNCQDVDLSTPLHYASSCGHADIVASLLGHGADPSLRDSDDESAVDCSASTKISELIKSHATLAS